MMHYCPKHGIVAHRRDGDKLICIWCEKGKPSSKEAVKKWQTACEEK